MPKTNLQYAQKMKSKRKKKTNTEEKERKKKHDDSDKRLMSSFVRQLFPISTLISWLFPYCKGGNFKIHIWAWFSYFIY